MLPPPPDRGTWPRQGYVVAITGCPGAGKTELVDRCINYEVRKRGRRAVLHDTTGDMTEYLVNKYNVARTQIVDVGSAAEAAKAFEGDYWNGPARIVAFRRERVRQAFHPHAFTKKDPDTTLQIMADEFVKFLDSNERRGYLGVSDEAELVWPNERLTGAALAVVKLARNRAQAIYLCCQMPQYVATLVRANAFHVAVFGGDSEQYIDPGCKPFGSPHLFDSALELPVGKYLYRPRWRENRRARLQVYDGLKSPIPWLSENPS